MWPGEPDDKTVRSMRGGLELLGKVPSHLATGLNLTVRNVTTHTREELSEQEAMERLAAYGFLALLLGQCEVVTANEDKNENEGGDCRPRLDQPRAGRSEQVHHWRPTWQPLRPATTSTAWSGIALRDVSPPACQWCKVAAVPSESRTVRHRSRLNDLDLTLFLATLRLKEQAAVVKPVNHP